MIRGVLLIGTGLCLTWLGDARLREYGNGDVIGWLQIAGGLIGSLVVAITLIVCRNGWSRP